MIRRLAAAALLLLATALALAWVAPTPPQVLAALADPQGWVGLHGADAGVLVLAAGLCWLVLGWLALGIGGTLAGQLPGAAGRTARLLCGFVLPRALRQGVALALGVGLVTGSGSAALADQAGPRPEASSAAEVSLDWPLRPPVGPPSGTPPPEAPPAYGGPPGFGDPVDGVVVVQPGDSLWAIADQRLGPAATPAQIAEAVRAWYVVNRRVVGSDPDLIYPGQRLVAPPEQP